jgi:pimeloyl-ACP methyl ester carboxylesterase
LVAKVHVNFAIVIRHAKINLMGICMGGTFCVIYSALHPEKVKNLVTTVSPTNFDTDQGLLHIWMKNVDVDLMINAFGNMPGDIMNFGFLLLTYRVIDRSDSMILVEIVLDTGRYHQIRAQLAAVGCHIKGDLKYGAPRSNPGGGIHLHARTASFVHPVRREPLIITADPPDDPLWNAAMEKWRVMQE